MSSNPFVQVPNCISDRARLKAVLADFFPEDRQKANLLLLAYDEGIVEAIRETATIDSIFIGRFVKLLTSGYGVGESVAQAAVVYWVEKYGADALGKPCSLKQIPAAPTPAKNVPADSFASRSETNKKQPTTPHDATGLFKIEQRNSEWILVQYLGFDDADTVVVPNGITVIGEKAFENCKGIRRVTLPDGVKRIDNNAFYGCFELRDINFPHTITQIGKRAFEFSKLTSVAFPPLLSEISESAFSYCSALTSINLPNGIKAIRESAFENCDMLEMVVVPVGTTTIEGNAFSCRKLRDIYIPASVTDIGKNSIFSYRDNIFWIDCRITIHCEPGSPAFFYARKHGIKAVPWTP